MRWLVADVPQRVEVDIRPQDRFAGGAITLHVRVHDAEYLPLDNAQVAIDVTTPDGHKLALDAEPQRDEPARTQATLVPRQPGAYRAESHGQGGRRQSEVGEREAGWVAEPAADEFNNLRPNRAALEEIAAKTGGEVIAPRFESLRRRPTKPQRADHRAADSPGVAPSPVLSGDHRLPLRRMGPAPLEGAAVTLLTTKTQRARRILAGYSRVFRSLCSLCLRGSNYELAAVIVVLFGLFAAKAHAAERPIVIVIVGAPGETEYATQFHEWSEQWRAASKGRMPIFT